MATHSIFPISLTDADANVAAGAYTDVDDGIAGDSVTLDSVLNAWTNQSDNTANGNFSFGLTDAPSDFASFTSIQMQVRAQVTRNAGTDDTTTYRLDISGTNAPTDVIEFTEADVGSGFITRSFTNSGVTPSAADIDGWTVRCYQWLYSKTKGNDNLNIEIDEVELTLTYVASVTYNSDTEGKVSLRALVDGSKTYSADTEGKISLRALISAAKAGNLLYFPVRVPWTRQPPSGTPIDRTHPIGSRVLFAGPDAGGNDSVTGNPPNSIGAGITRGVVKHGKQGDALSYIKDSGDGSVTVNFPYENIAAHLEGKYEATLIGFVDMQGFIGTDDWEGFGVVNAEDADPFWKFVLSRNSSTDQAYCDANDDSAGWESICSSATGYWPSYPSGPICLGVSRGQSATRFFKNGEFNSEDTAYTAKTFGFAAGDAVTLFQQRSPSDGSANQGWYGNFPLMLIIDGFLTDAEHADIYRNPWQIYEPETVWYAIGGTTAFTAAILARISPRQLVATAKTSTAQPTGRLSLRALIAGAVASAFAAAGRISIAIRQISASSKVTTSAPRAPIATRASDDSAKTSTASPTAKISLRAMIDGAIAGVYAATVRASVSLRSLVAAAPTKQAEWVAKFLIRASQDTQKTIVSTPKARVQHRPKVTAGKTVNAATIARLAIGAVVVRGTDAVFSAAIRASLTLQALSDAITIKQGISGASLSLRGLADASHVKRATVRASLALRLTDNGMKTTGASSLGRIAIRESNSGAKTLSGVAYNRLAIRSSSVSFVGMPGTISRVVPLSGIFDPEIPLQGRFDPDSDLEGTFDPDVTLSGKGDPV